MYIGLIIPILAAPPLSLLFSWALISYHGMPKRNPLFLALLLKPNIVLLLTLLPTEIQWLRQLLLDLGILVQVPIRLFCDNISATYLAANPVLHSRNNHIKVDYHFVREMVSKCHLQVKFIPTQSQVADIFTKGLSLQKFLQFKVNLSVVPPRID